MRAGGPVVRPALAEMFGTFVLVFAGTGSMVIDSETGGGVGHVGVALTFGLVVFAMIHAVGGVSGAHLNPAVTLGLWAAGRYPARGVIPHVAAQLIGALAASVALRLMFPDDSTLGATLPVGPASRSWVLEFILTCILMAVILAVADGVRGDAALAIGAVVGLEAMFAGPISGASMNPARSLAPALISGHVEHLWIYITATVAGALAGVAAWTVIHPKEASR